MRFVAWLDEHVLALCGGWFAALCLILAVLFAGGCEDADDGVTPSDCGEMSSPCEGQ